MQDKTDELIACSQCGLVSTMPSEQRQAQLCCPRCGHTLTLQVKNSAMKVRAYGLSCLIMLALSCTFPFMSFSADGLSNHIYLLNAVDIFGHFGSNALAVMMLFTIILLPALYIICVIALYSVGEHLKTEDLPPFAMNILKQIIKMTFRVEIWLLVDVFLVGVLVSLAKISAMADVSLGSAFWTYCGYSVLLLLFTHAIDKTWLWRHIFPSYSTGEVKAGDTHLSQNHIPCPVCQQINPTAFTQQDCVCIRCGSLLHPYLPMRGVIWSASFLISAIIFYIPANFNPMMYTASLGSTERSTIMDGVILLWQMGSYPIAAIIFIASLLVPLTKMCILIWLLLSARHGYVNDETSLKKLKYYRAIEFIGRWSMIDVCVVAILSALVALKGIMSISPGPAVLYFAIVVFFTMCSALLFDPRVFWGKFEPPPQQQKQNKTHFSKTT